MFVKFVLNPFFYKIECLYKYNFRGQLMLELLLAIGLSALLLPILFVSLMSSRDNKFREAQQTQATTILKETEEAVRGVKNAGWAMLPESGTFYPVVQGSQWALVPGASSSGGFSRQVVISEVRRDPDSGAIVESGGFVDPSTKKVDITVSWTEPHSSSIDSSFYLTRNDNMSRVGGLDDFLAGSHTQTQATSSAGGRLLLEYNTKGQWCSPAFARDGTGTEITIPLPDGPPVALAASVAASTTVPNDVFVATSPNTSNSIKLAYLSTTANTSFPQSTLRGIFTLDPARYTANFPSGLGFDNNFKTNNVKLYKSSAGKLYALITTTMPDREVIAVLINDNNFANNNSNDGEYQNFEANPKIFKYWTFFNTRNYLDANTGTRSPQEDIADTGGDNNGYANGVNAHAQAGSVATDTNSGTNNNITAPFTAGSGKDRHRFWGYNFAIPSDAIIKGVDVRIDASVTNNSCASTKRIYGELSWDGGNTWTPVSDYVNVDGSLDTAYLGSSTDTWGRTWSFDNFTSPNFVVRLINVANDTDCEFRLDYVGARVYYNSMANNQSPHGHGATAISILDNTGYVASGGFLYAMDLSGIDGMSESTRINGGLPMKGCRIEMNGEDCISGCQQGGWEEFFATNDLFSVRTNTGSPVGEFVFAAVGFNANPELDIVNVSNAPNESSSPSIRSSYCGIMGSNNTNAGWKLASDLDFNSQSNTMEASNSIFVNSDGTRAYMTSNGGVDANNDGIPDSHQFYIINTTNKTSPQFISGVENGGATSGFYYGRRNLALNRPVTASSQSNPASNAVDGSLSTNWYSTSSNTQWIYVDLGAVYNIDQVLLNWASQTYARTYQIQVSNDANSWSDIYSTSSGNGGLDNLTSLTGSGRYLRVYATQRGSTSYGYRLNEITIYGLSPGQTDYNEELFPKTSLTVLNGKRAVVVGKDGYSNSKNTQEYQVLNLEATENQIKDDSAYCGGLDYNAGFNGLTAVQEADGDNFVYMISGSGTNELKIIQGGPDGNFMDTGEYTSPVIDIGYSTIFNRFTTNSLLPVNTSLSYQFAIASPSAGQTCADVNYDFTGYGGNPASRYGTTSAALWVGESGSYKNPGRCIRYRAFLSTNNYDASPELRNMIINFAP